jgi:hypothetical protein
MAQVPAWVAQALGRIDEGPSCVAGSVVTAFIERRAIVVFGAMALLVAVVVIGLASRLSFHGDEWAYIVDRRLTLDSLLQPHNEHLVALHVLTYRGMVEAIGIGSYVPFLVALMAIHVAAAAGVMALLSRYVPLAGALAGGVVMLCLGTGFDNLVWAFQTGFAGAIAFGIWAMVARDRSWLAAGLLTAALWTQGSGLFYVLPVAIMMRDRRWLALPLGTYVAWLLLVGRESVPFPGAGPYLAYALTGVGSGVGGVAGVGVVGGWLIVGIVAVLLVRSGRPPIQTIAGIAGLISTFAILAFGRAHFWAGAGRSSALYLCRHAVRPAHLDGHSGRATHRLGCGVRRCAHAQYRRAAPWCRHLSGVRELRSVDPHGESTCTVPALT